MVNIAIGRYADLIRKEERLEQIFRLVCNADFINKEDIIRIIGTSYETEVFEDE